MNRDHLNKMINQQTINELKIKNYDKLAEKCNLNIDKCLLVMDFVDYMDIKKAE